MEKIKELLEFTNSAVFYDYKNTGIIRELNPVRTFIINSFYKTIPYTRILVSLGITDDIILKNSTDDIENILDGIHNLRENILYMFSCEKTIKDEQQQNLINDDDKYENINKDRSDDEDENKFKYKLLIFRQKCQFINGCKSERIL